MKKYGLGNDYSNFGFGNYSCFKQTKNGIKLIIGRRNGTNFYGISKSVYKETEEIRKALNSSFLQTSFLSSFDDSLNYNNPIQYLTESSNIILDNNLHIFTTYYFSSLFFESENNLILNTKKKYSSIISSDFITDINLSTDKEENILHFIYLHL